MDSADPFWGPPTSHANFCEADYAVSRYIAEFINSLTNLIYVIYGIYGLHQLRGKANKSKSGYSDYLRALPYWGLIAVGICSFSFHLSLKYYTQMMDDLSMLFTTTPVLHRVLTANSTRRDSTIIATVLSSLLLLLVTFHVMTDELVVHSVSFVGSVAIIGAQTVRLVKSRTIEGSDTRRQIWGMVRFGAAIFILGFWVWLIDQWACGFLTAAREAIGLPWAFFLELHGWWHIFTGIGAYIFIAVVDLLVSDEDLKDLCAQQTFAWPASWASTSIFAGEPHQTMDIGEKEE
ncbi:alkaline ceramidase family protein [Penicillium waksmanii]|uniref:alkaline ceramidase family protein n=1 Tax=Penicillium waksmanii TaxID=69791 RepID=UPI00254906AE|nr:alkaline ceramidase family protein [Penicillium waksmanii]KAJ5999976.1 alkaline ceramidase family protein [Penicillium waksmanii]